MIRALKSLQRQAESIWPTTKLAMYKSKSLGAQF